MNRGLMVRIGLLALALHFGFLAAAGEDTPGLATEWRYPWPREHQIVLDGVWNVAWTDPDAATTLPEGLDALDWFEAELPAEAHWALYRAGNAPHPYAGQNAAAMRWVMSTSAKSSASSRAWCTPAICKAATPAKPVPRAVSW